MIKEQKFANIQSLQVGLTKLKIVGSAPTGSSNEGYMNLVYNGEFYLPCGYGANGWIVFRKLKAVESNEYGGVVILASDETYRYVNGEYVVVGG